MKNVAGRGTLLSQGAEISVTYDLVPSPAKDSSAVEGQVFGDKGALWNVYRTGPCGLRLENGHVTQIVLLNCDVDGGADARVTGTMDRD